MQKALRIHREQLVFQFSKAADVRWDALRVLLGLTSFLLY